MIETNELLDVIDEHGQPTGEVLPREEIYRRGLWKWCVQLFIVNDRGQILLQRRAASKRRAPNAWDTSVAGHVSHGDTTRATAVRELREELGIVATEDELEPFGQLTIADDKPFVDPPSPAGYGRASSSWIDNQLNDVFILHRSFDPATLTLQSEEVAEVRWFTPAEFDEGLRVHPREFTTRTKRELFDRIIAYARRRRP